MKLTIKIISSETYSDEMISKSTRLLKNEILNFETVNLNQSEYIEPAIDSNTKGDPLTLGILFLTLSPVILESFLNFLQNRTIDSRKISVEAPNGAKVEFTSSKKYSKDEMLELITELNEIK